MVQILAAYNELSNAAFLEATWLEKIGRRSNKDIYPSFLSCSPPFSLYCGLFFFYTDITTFMNVINTRFIAARGGARISLSCSFGSLASWHKETGQGYSQEITNTSRVHVTRNTSMVMMQINKLQHTDNGIYHCKIKDSLKPTCGTELKVMGKFFIF